MENGQCKAGYVATTLRDAAETKSLPDNTSAQEAELIALTKALGLKEGKTPSVYTDSKYAFGVLHGHGAIWRERGLQ